MMEKLSFFALLALLAVSFAHETSAVVLQIGNSVGRSPSWRPNEPVDSVSLLREGVVLGSGTRLVVSGYLENRIALVASKLKKAESMVKEYQNEPMKRGFERMKLEFELETLKKALSAFKAGDKVLLEPVFQPILTIVSGNAEPWMPLPPPPEEWKKEIIRSVCDGLRIFSREQAFKAVLLNRVRWLVRKPPYPVDEWYRLSDFLWQVCDAAGVPLK